MLCGTFNIITFDVVVERVGELGIMCVRYEFGHSSETFVTQHTQTHNNMSE